MFYSTKGIVLHKTKYSDSSLIVKIYTETFGTLSFIVKNAYSKKAKISASLFSTMSVLNITFNYLPNREIFFIKEAVPHKPFLHIPFDLSKNAILLFYNELLYKLLYQADADSSMFQLIEENLYQLDEERGRVGDWHIKFLLKLIHHLGIEPENNYSQQNSYFSISRESFVPLFSSSDTLSASASSYLSSLFAEKTVEKVSKEVRLETLYGLVNYIQVHNEHIGTLTSLSILSEILKK